MSQQKIPNKTWLRDGYTMGGRLDRALKNDVAPSMALNQKGAPHLFDQYWMEQALLTAMNGIGWSSPNPSVGAVIVDPATQSEISRGFTQKFRHEHAERMAIIHAQGGPMVGSLQGATMYVTLEPCAHFGSQPPCANLVVNAGIKRVVIGTRDPDVRVNGMGIAHLQSSGVQVEVGVLQSECQAWHFPFLRTRLPEKKILWAGKWAQDRNGDLADAQGNSKWISSEKSRAYTHWLRQKYDAIVVGAATYLADRPKLTVRDCATPHRRDPVRIVFDPKCRLQPLFDQGGLDPQNLPHYWVVGPHTNVKAPGSVRLLTANRADFSAMCDAVESLVLDPPLQSVMVEGGAALLNALIQEGRFDVIHQFIAAEKELHGPAFRVRWSADEKWFCAASQKIESDDLQEWVKSF